MTEPPPQPDKLDQPLPWWVMVFITLYLFAFLCVLIFPAAGDWSWRFGWLFVITTTLNISVGYILINQKNPRVIRNRSKIKKEGITADTQKASASDWFIYPLMAIGFFGAMILSSLGHRYGWYILPFWVSVIAAVIMNAGVVVLNIATLQNSYASKLLDINQGQVLVDTGLYARVRHPLYAGGIVMALSMPIVLGSLWGLIPATFAAMSLVIRIEFEEEMLVKGMEGYADYRTRVKYKLIPKIY
jgi:protein-S-isoprenylcysteine O-methyltransferase Ste14